jgi:hypothetical protein
MPDTTFDVTPGTGTDFSMLGVTSVNGVTVDQQLIQRLVWSKKTSADAIADVDDNNPMPFLSLNRVTTTTVDITRPADTTAYAVNDALSDSTSAPTSGGFTLSSLSRASGRSVMISDVLVMSSNNAATALQGEIWLFDTAVTNVNDNSAFAISDAENKTVVGVIPFTLEAGTNNSFAHIRNLNLFATPSGSANLRFLIRVKNVYTPASAEVITVRVKSLQVD